MGSPFTTFETSRQISQLVDGASEFRHATSPGSRRGSPVEEITTVR